MWFDPAWFGEVEAHGGAFSQCGIQIRRRAKRTATSRQGWSRFRHNINSISTNQCRHADSLRAAPQAIQSLRL